MDYDPTKQALFHPEDRDTTPGFSHEWSPELICAELSRLAYYKYEYGGGQRLGAALSGAGFGEPEYFVHKRAGAQGFGTVCNNVAYVAFRGTQPDSLLDLLADARIRMLPCPGGGRVHRGFQDAFESLRLGVDQWVPGTECRELVVTGHSLGAAMATVMAAAYPAAKLITFGSPRVGDREFAARFAGRDVLRFVDCADMVTRVPPEVLGYVHLDGMRYIDRAGVVGASPPQAEIDADRAAARLAYLPSAVDVWHNVPARDLADHAPINYIGALLGGRTGP